MSKKILVIENQITQFETVVEKLTNAGHDTFPEFKNKNPEHFNRFITWVSIWLNRNYKERRGKSLEKITTDVKKWGIDLFIIDYRLGGSSESFTGIDLALELARENMFPNKPFIFLSRTPENTKELELDRLRKIEYEWVEKGYSGRSLYENDYFNRYVVGAIENLVTTTTIITKENETKKYREIIKELLQHQSISREYGGFFEPLQSLTLFPEHIKEMLNELQRKEAWKLSSSGINKIIQKAKEEN